jgi:haloalkane dehalogenase
MSDRSLITDPTRVYGTSPHGKEILMPTPNPPSPDFPFESRYLDVLGSRMHYIQSGSGDPILFLHGNPTSSYLWRNIIPYLSEHGRCIAPDLIGMGKSDKPDIPYRFIDHVRYIEGFIEGMDLSNITLVIHDWGSGLGFHYASRHESNVKALAFMEAILKPMSWSAFPPEFKMGFKLMRTPGVGWLMISAMNMFVNQLLPKATARKLTPEEMSFYREPLRTIRSRRPVRRWPCEIPIDGKPADMHQIVTSYNSWLQETELPKLLFFATPGGIVDASVLAWCKRHLKKLRTVDIGPGIHYLQEDNPDMIGEKLAQWYQQL